MVENDVQPVHQVEILQNLQDIKMDSTTGLGVYQDLINAFIFTVFLFLIHFRLVLRKSK